MQDQTLSESDLRSTMTAMVTIITSRNAATRSRAENFPMSWKGQTVSGEFAAAQVFLESLAEHADAWILYLTKGENRKVAMSMDVALNNDLAARLESMPEGDRVLEALRMAIDVVPVFEPELTGEHRVIDLRQQETV